MKPLVALLAVCLLFVAQAPVRAEEESAIAKAAKQMSSDAKKAGKIRFIGFTGHKDPDIHLRMLSFGFPFDACQLPLNGFDAVFHSFQRRVLPELARQKIAAIGMKSLGGDGDAIGSFKDGVDLVRAVAESGQPLDEIERDLQFQGSKEPLIGCLG